MDISFYSGDSRNLIVNIVDQNNTPISLTGATIEWILMNQNNTILLKSVGSGITISSSATGQFTISLMPSDTKNLNGTYQHMARVSTTDGSSSIVLTGTVTVTSSLI